MRITTYKELEVFIKAFSLGHINLCIILSRGGLGKTRLVNDAIDDKISLKFSAHCTPLALYLQVMKAKGNGQKLVILDDIDDLLQSSKAVAILKQICQTEPVKTIRYDTSTKYEGCDISRSYDTDVKVILMTNDLKRFKDKNMQALLTRGFLIDFCPDNEEILDKMSCFVEDKEVLNHLKAVAGKISDFNFRTYWKCVELKKSGICWKGYLKTEYAGIDSEKTLLSEIKGLPVKKRNKIWCERTGLSVRTLRRHLKKLGY